MPKLFHIEASPRAALSQSSSVASALVDTLRGKEWSIDHLQLWSSPLPELNGYTLSAKYSILGGKPHADGEATAWQAVSEHVARLAHADRVLISTPMWNLGIPYKLKQWIDIVTQPTLSFGFDPTHGYSPLLTDRPTTVVLSSAGDYSNGPSWGRPDLASDYLRTALGFIGLRSVEIVLVGPTVGDARLVSAARDEAGARLAEIGERA